MKETFDGYNLAQCWARIEKLEAALREILMDDDSDPKCHCTTCDIAREALDKTTGTGE